MSVEPIDKPDKGQFDGSCNRRVCQRPGAIFYNQSTRKFYCGRCAAILNKENAIEAERLYGSQLCVGPDHEAFPRLSKDPETPAGGGGGRGAHPQCVRRAVRVR